LAKTKLITSSNVSNTVSADEYHHIVGIIISLTPNTIESRTQITARQGGTLSKLAVNITASTTGVVDFRSSINGANGNQVVSYASGETGIKEDLLNTDTVTAGDEINHFVDWISGTSVTLSNLQLVFDSSTNTYQWFGSVGIPTSQVDNLIRYYHFSTITAQATETNAQTEMLTAGTGKHLFVNVTANTTTTANSTFRTRKGAVNGNCNVVYAAAETGVKEDTSNTDTIADGNLYNFQLDVETNAGSTSITFTTISIGFETTNSQYQETVVSNGVAIAFNLTRYINLAGSPFSNATETNIQTTSRTGNTDLKELLTEVSANTITTSATTIDYRINVGGNHLQISYAAAETGTKSVTGTIAIVDGDEVNYRMITPNTSGSITFQQMSSLYTPTVSGPTESAGTFATEPMPPTAMVV